MIADYFNKPLQGNQFKKFRYLIQGITDIDSTDRSGICCKAIKRIQIPRITTIIQNNNKRQKQESSIVDMNS
jgi:hypothetical protein